MDWTAIIVAAITTFIGPAIVAYLKHRGKKKLAEALQVVVDAVEQKNDKEVKEIVELNTREMPALRKLIDQHKVEAEAKHGGKG